MKLLELYRHILAYTGIVVNDDGSTDISLAGTREPNLINKKRVMLPYDKVLKSDDANVVIFHPAIEYVNRGESDVVRKLRRLLNIRINLAIIGVMDGLLRLLESPAEHKLLDSQQREILRSVSAGSLKNVNGDSVLRAKLASLVSRNFSAKPDSLFFNLFMKKSGTFKGQKHQRVGVVTFNFHEVLEENAEHFNKEQIQVLKSLFDFMFPDNHDLDAEAWNGYSDSTQCPWLDCLLKTSFNVVCRLKELTNLYADFMRSPETGDISEDVLFDVDWVTGMDNIEQYKREIALIPSQGGNEGSIEPTQAAGTASPLASAAVSAANAPIRAAAGNQAAQQQPHQVQQVQQAPQQPQPYVNPYYQQMQPPPPPPPPQLTADGRIDLSNTNAFGPTSNMIVGDPNVMMAGMMPLLQQQQAQQQMMLQQQMMQNPGLMAAYANNGMLPPGMMPQQMMPQQVYGQPNMVYPGMMPQQMPQQMYQQPQPQYLLPGNTQGIPYATTRSAPGGMSIPGVPGVTGMAGGMPAGGVYNV